MEQFEDEFGSEAVIDFDKIGEASEIEYYEKLRRIREARYKWIFENQRSQYKVRSLIERIQKSTSPPMTTDEFSRYISIAFHEVTKELKSRLLDVAPNIFELLSSTDNEGANAALELFMSMYDYEEPSVRKIE